jgi:hypothetical protein
MKKGKRRWWLIALIVVIVVAAAVTAALLLLNRGKSDGVHYLTSTAAMGTIADTVQSDFTLASARNATTISLSGTGSSSSTSAATTASTVATRGAVTLVSAVTTHRAAAAPATIDRAIIADATPASTPTSAPTPTITALVPTSGPVGSAVTLIGGGFTGATAVAFGGHEARFTVNSDTQITATVPSGATSGPLSVTTPGGLAISAASFTVRPTPSRSGTPTPKPTSSRSGSGGSSTGRSFAGAGSAATTSSSTGSTTASGSTVTSGVVTGIRFAAGATPRTLQHLLTISGKPIYAFVSSAPLYATLSTSLSSGAQKSNVAVLQHALKADGYFTGTINGDFGATTQTALEDWQVAHGLTKTGQITTSQFVWVPKGAIVEAWNVSLGGRVSSATALANVDFPRDLIVRTLVTQADISSLKVGQKAALTIDGATSDPFTATITSISSQPASSSSSGSSSAVDYTVDLAPHGLPSLAKSGMTGSLIVTIASRSNVLVVPTSAVSGSSSASFVRVMQNGTPTYRQVTTGMTTSSLTQITSGLTSGEVVVTGQYTNSATSSTSTGSGLGGLGGLGGFGGGGFRRSTGGSTSGGSGGFGSGGGQ